MRQTSNPAHAITVPVKPAGRFSICRVTAAASAVPLILPEVQIWRRGFSIRLDKSAGYCGKAGANNPSADNKGVI